MNYVISGTALSNGGPLSGVNVNLGGDSASKHSGLGSFENRKQRVLLIQDFGWWIVHGNAVVSRGLI